jgi:predicted ATPase
LIETLFSAPSASSLLLIGAYRDNEVGDDHPLAVSQGKLQAETDRVTVFTLGDLASDDTNRLLADTMHLTAADCRELSQALVDKTAGNPFYFRQQLYALESEELLSFDREQGRWVWEEDLQHCLQPGGNVVDLMTRNIQTLPVETQQTLSMAACIGSRFEASTLNTITGRSQEDVLSDLNPALDSGLIVRSNGYFSFAHDRIQEAGYALIPKSDLPQTHLEIGRLLLASTPAEELEEEIFFIVGHLNVGRALIDTDSEKTNLAALNLKAGQKTKAAAAFADPTRSAADYQHTSRSGSGE